MLEAEAGGFGIQGQAWQSLCDNISKTKPKGLGMWL
jgi:hypothetical protein